MTSDAASRLPGIRPEAHDRTTPLIEEALLPMLEVEGADHTISFVNAGLCRLLKRPSNELLGRRFSEIVLDSAKCIPVLDRVRETGEFETLSELDVSGPSPAVWLYAMWPSLDEQNRPAGVVIQLSRSSQLQRNSAEMNGALLISGLRQHELREAAEEAKVRLQIELQQRQRVEQELRIAQAELRLEADRLEARVLERTTQLRASIGELEAFSYSLAHDLRAPVRAINSFTNLALEMSPQEVGPSAAELLRRVVKAAVRMDTLIRDVLGLSEVILKPIARVSVDVEALIRALLDERPEFSAEHAEITIQTPLIPMCGHEPLLGQCFSNLLDNAIKFVAPGVRPHVRIWTEEIPPRWAEDLTTGKPAADQRPRVRLWIADNGIGIAEKDREKIFAIFQRLHASLEYGGTGIGLAIVHKAIHRMGGNGGVESSLGEGSRFWLELTRG